MSTVTLTELRNLPRPSRTPTARPRAFRLMALATILPVVTVLSVGLIRRGGLGDLTGTVILWVALVAIVDLVPVPRGDSLRFELDLPLLMAAAFLFGPIVAGTIAFAGAFDERELRGRIPLLNALFNRSQTALSVMAGAAVFHSLGGEVGAWPGVLGIAAVALLADSLVNYLLVGTAVSLLHRTGWLKSLARMRFGRPVEFGATYAAFGILGVVLAEIQEKVGAWGLLAFALPAILARQAFSQTELVEVKEEEVKTKERALSEMLERLALERQDERSRIASSLHDRVLQGLYYVTLHAHVIRQDLREGRLLQLDEDLPGLMQAAEQTSEAIREVILGLRKSPLGPGGLVATLNLLIRTLVEDHGLPIEAAVEPVDLTPGTQLVLYQVAQEALVNAAKHSEASRIRVLLLGDEDYVRLVVEDDGKGFVLNLVNPQKNFGLVLMRERIALVGGDLLVVSEPGAGTTVSARVPRGGLQKG